MIFHDLITKKNNVNRRWGGKDGNILEGFEKKRFGEKIFYHRQSKLRCYGLRSGILNINRNVTQQRKY